MAKRTLVSDLSIDDNGEYTPVFRSYTVLSASKAFIKFFNETVSKHSRTMWCETDRTWYMLRVYNSDGVMSKYCAFTDRRLCTEPGFLEFIIRLISEKDY